MGVVTSGHQAHEREGAHGGAPGTVLQSPSSWQPVPAGRRVQGVRAARGHGRRRKPAHRADGGGTGGGVSG
eukprot:364418-Chlamydomonas_euryale.AAC.14